MYFHKIVLTYFIFFHGSIPYLLNAEANKCFWPFFQVSGMIHPDILSPIHVRHFCFISHLSFESAGGLNFFHNFLLITQAIPHIFRN